MTLPPFANLLDATQVPEISHEKKRYDVLNVWCLGRRCLKLGEVYPSVLIDGKWQPSEEVVACCLTRFHRGCPKQMAGYDAELAAERLAQGYGY